MDKSGFDEKGYIIGKKLLPLELLEEIRMEVKELFKKQTIACGLDFSSDINGLPSFKTLCDFFKYDKERYINTLKVANRLTSIYKLVSSDLIVETCKTLGLGSPFSCARPNFSVMHKKTSENESNWLFPLHQDWRSIQGSLNLLIIWIPLINIFDEIGPLQVIPGSHKELLYGVKKDDWFMSIDNKRFSETEFVSLDMDFGDVLFFSGFLVHKSGLLKTDNHRWSIQLRFNDLDDETYKKRGYPLTFSSERPTIDYIQNEKDLKIENLKYLKSFM